MAGIKDTGSNYSFFEKDSKANVNKSAFDMSYITTFTAKEGQLIPYWWQYTLMNEDWKKTVECLASVVNPPVVPLFSRQRIFFHEYWLSFTQLWKQAQIFFDKGHTKNQFESASNLRIPKIKLSKWERGSLADLLGFNFVRADENGYYICNALKFMAYLRIVRDMYMNKRIWASYLELAIAGEYFIKNPLYDSTDPTSNENLTTAQVTKIYNFMFPMDDADFRIGTPQWNEIVTDDEIIQYLFGTLWYRDYTDDYFTTGTTEPIFGDIPTINGTILGDTLFEKVAGIGGESGLSNLTSGKNIIGFGSYTGGDVTRKQLGIFKEIENEFAVTKNEGQSISGKNWFGTGAINFTGNTRVANLSGSNTVQQTGTMNQYNYEQDTSAKYQDFIDAFNNTMRLKVSDIATSFTIDQIRAAESATIILEKMAKTDGSYKMFAEIMFGENPKSAYDYRPTYVGGAYQSIVYQQVINTAGASGGNAQGEITGSGLSSGEGFIGNHHSDDYGVFLGIMSIMPDTYYSQGLQREDTYETAEDFYLPDRAELGKQGIKNAEIYNDPQNADYDKIFAWQNRFDELRYRANEVHCELAEQDNEDFKPYIQSRYFNSMPTLSPEFLTTKGNIDKDWLTVDEDLMSPFIVQIGNKVNAIRPLPYRAEPATFGM